MVVWFDYLVWVVGLGLVFMIGCLVTSLFVLVSGFVVLFGVVACLLFASVAGFDVVV